jgi:hypothetical protein
MRHFSFNALMLLLMVVAIAAPLGAQDWSNAPAPSERPAGCHGHGDPPPAAPQSHQCCQSGHDAAVLLPSSAPQVWLQVSATPAVLMSALTQPVRAVHRRIVLGDRAIPSPLRV